MERDREALQAALTAYELAEELGRGGWGIVYAARHRRLQRQVAVKMLPRAFGADPEVRARFEEEAQFAARLSHPHIVGVFDYLDEGGVLAIVMERMQAQNLAERFDRDGVLQDTACAMSVAVGSALHAAHRMGRVHRDVKPENVLFDAGDVPKLSDFGVAKIIGIGDGLTRAGDVIGTPAYMSPEQATGGTIGPASDVYSTAVVTYELLSGRLPFPPAETALAQLYQHVHETPVPLELANPDVGAPIARAVMRGLAKDPTHRYESAEAFAIAMGQAATEVFGSGWLRDAGVEIRLTGRLVDAFRQSTRPTIAQRLPALTVRTEGVDHPRLGTVYETGADARHGNRAARSPASTAADVAGFAMEVAVAPTAPPPQSRVPGRAHPSAPYSGLGGGQASEVGAPAASPRPDLGLTMAPHTRFEPPTSESPPSAAWTPPASTSAPLPVPPPSPSAAGEPPVGAPMASFPGGGPFGAPGSSGSVVITPFVAAPNGPSRRAKIARVAIVVVVALALLAAAVFAVTGRRSDNGAGATPVGTAAAEFRPRV